MRDTGDPNQPGNVIGTELDQHVHVAVRPEIVAQGRPEQRQAGDVVALTEGGQGGLRHWNRDAR